MSCVSLSMSLFVSVPLVSIHLVFQYRWSPPILFFSTVGHSRPLLFFSTFGHCPSCFSVPLVTGHLVFQYLWSLSIVFFSTVGHCPSCFSVPLVTVHLVFQYRWSLSIVFFSTVGHCPSCFSVPLVTVHLVFQYRWSLSILFFIEMAGIVLIFVVVYVPDATKQLQIYPEDALKDAIIRYRDDADTQDFIDGVQQEVILASRVITLIRL